MGPAGRGASRAEEPAALRGALADGDGSQEGAPGGPRPSTAVLLSNVLSGAQALVP